MKTPLSRVAIVSLSVLILAAVTTLYVHPRFVLTLAGQLWTCF